ncbi:tol-pal system YbgF family protein [Bacteroidota bacterium]
MALSLLISDNTGSDSTESALKMYSRADLQLFQKKDSAALITLDSLLSIFPNHSLIDEALFKKAEINEKMDNYVQAAEIYNRIFLEFPEDILADNSLYKYALTLENKLDRKEEAMEVYRELMNKYPGSIFVSDSRKRYRNLKNTFNPDEVGKSN